MGSHTGDYLAEELFAILEEFNITEKLFCITTDAASNNTSLVSNLSSILKTRKDIEWDHKKMHINCLDHVINLAVQKFLRSIKVVKSRDDEEDGEVEVVDSETESFAGTLTKIRGLAKVLLLSPVTCKAIHSLVKVSFARYKSKVMLTNRFFVLVHNNGRNL